MRVAIYCRVSTDDQKTQQQVDACVEWVERKGWKWDLFEENESAKGTSRVELQKMLKGVDKGKFKAVVVWKVDRLTRSIQDFVSVFKRVKDAGAGIVSVTQGIDTTGDDANSRMMVNILMVFAEWERDMIVERTKAGLKRAVKEGKKLGRKQVMFSVVDAWRKWKRGVSFRDLEKEFKVSKSTIANKVREFDKVGGDDD